MHKVQNWVVELIRMQQILFRNEILGENQSLFPSLQTILRQV